jgi:predicted metal-dependent hydrolase
MSEIYIEFHRSGKVTKVTAIDPESGTEVSTICPSGLTKQQMKLMAAKKLQYVMERDGNFRTDSRDSGVDTVV